MLIYFVSRQHLGGPLPLCQMQKHVSFLLPIDFLHELLFWILNTKKCKPLFLLFFSIFATDSALCTSTSTWCLIITFISSFVINKNNVTTNQAYCNLIYQSIIINWVTSPACFNHLLIMIMIIKGFTLASSALMLNYSEKITKASNNNILKLISYQICLVN